jgi:two-component system, OmpR family, phosphate regulon response regulator PhoB
VVLAAPVLSGEDEPAGSLGGSATPRLHAVGADEPRAGRAGAPAVLLVEDDAAMRLVCTFNLELAGFRVATAERGREGLEAARAERFDLVLLDVMLPDLGGFEVAAELRTDAATRDVPVVFISARTSSQDLARGRAVGAIDYVTKPFDPVELAARLREDLEELAGGGADHVWELRFGRPPDTTR